MPTVARAVFMTMLMIFPTQVSGMNTLAAMQNTQEWMSEEAVSEEAVVSAEDEEDGGVSLVQGALRRKQLEAAMAAASASQAAVEPVRTEAPAMPAVMSAVLCDHNDTTEPEMTIEPKTVSPPFSGVPEDENPSCKLDGLTPGVCAMSVLARGPVDSDSKGPSDLNYLQPEQLERALYSEIESALTGTHGEITSERLQNLEKKLKGLFATLPKNGYGGLSHAATRYAVHQYFLRQHGWTVHSLNPVGEAQTPPSPAEALRGRVPEHLQSLIEKHQGKDGVGLRELTALVATLEYLIEGDLSERLRAAYAAHNLAQDTELKSFQVQDVLKTYMAHFLSLKHRSGYASPEEARLEQLEIETGLGKYIWTEVTGYIWTEVTKSATFSFANVTQAAKQVDLKYEKYLSDDCESIKQSLSAFEDGASGQAPLGPLHKAALEGQSQFGESTEYLRKVGALDESDPSDPRVLMPNYIYGPSNCLGTTSFFDMCCPDHCEVLLEQLENSFNKADEVTAEQILSNLAPVLGDGSHTPYAELTADLKRVEETHSGNVPLHGRDFAEWLHSAFPRRCARPRAEAYDGAKVFGTGDVPDAAREFQEVADVMDFVKASDEELKKEQVELEKVSRGGLKSKLAQKRVQMAANQTEAVQVPKPAVAPSGRRLKIKRREEL